MKIGLTAFPGLTASFLQVVNSEKQVAGSVQQHILVL
jgi:hypothetical protein